MKITVSLLILFLIIPFSKIQAQKEKILLEEHFVENERGWTLGDDDNVVRKIEKGKLTIESKKYSGGGFWIKLPDFKLPANNYSIAVTTSWLKNKAPNDFAPYGLIIGDYYFLIYANGDRRLLKYNSADNKYETIVDWSVTTVIHKLRTGDNRLEITYSDGKIAFYANGQMLYKKDAVIPEGTLVKLYIEKSEVVSFDDLIIKAL